MSNTPNLTININSVDDFLSVLGRLQFGDVSVGADQGEVPATYGDASDGAVEMCECGLPVDYCESQYVNGFELTPEGQAHFEYLAAEAELIAHEAEVLEFQEERRDAIAVLGLAIKDNSEAISTFSRLVEAEYGYED